MFAGSSDAAAIHKAGAEGQVAPDNNGDGNAAAVSAVAEASGQVLDEAALFLRAVAANIQAGKKVRAATCDVCCVMCDV